MTLIFFASGFSRNLYCSRCLWDEEVLISSRHFLKPEDMSLIEIMLFKYDAWICGCFFLIQGKNIFVSHLSLSC